MLPKIYINSLEKHYVEYVCWQPVHFIPYVVIVEVHFLVEVFFRLVEVFFRFSFAPSVIEKNNTISKNFNVAQRALYDLFKTYMNIKSALGSRVWHTACWGSFISELWL